MQHQIPIDPHARADVPEQDAARHDGTHEVAPDVAYKRLMLVNVAFIGMPLAHETVAAPAETVPPPPVLDPTHDYIPKPAPASISIPVPSSERNDERWVLVDAGIPGHTGAILTSAEQRFGARARPAAIVLTHGHFDHVGNLLSLAEHWDVPIYAHTKEMPYLDGSYAYPPPDPGVGGGILSALSGLFPRGPIDVSHWLRALPVDGSLPELPEWRWLPTPGHSPGHISLWRERDRTLIVGDAFITTTQESAYAVATQRMELHGPPMYFTPDWHEARLSVERLAALEPEIAITGHGRAMRGPELRTALHQLAQNFDRIAVPEHGRYVLGG